jgi:hypothetical protein
MPNADPLAAVFDGLKVWGPLLSFIGVWLYAMRRYSSQSSQWGQAARHLEAIEKHLAHIASLLEERRGK